MLSQIGSAAVARTKAIFGFVIVFLFFVLLFTSYSGILRPQPRLCQKTDAECVLTKRDDVITKNITPKRIRSKTPTDNSLEENFFRVQSKIQRQRLYQLQKTCETFYPFEAKSTFEELPYDLLVDEEHQLAYCSIAKIASTSWKRVWLVLTGRANSTFQFSQQVVNNMGKREMRHLFTYPPEMIAHILANYTKFMFSRHPLSRVLSAFRNKLAPDSTFILRERWRNNLGSAIIKKYRPNDPNYQDLNYTLNHYDLTFTEFIRYISDSTNPDKKAVFNNHWMEMYAKCSPCEVHYDFIGNYETLPNDARYILKMAKVDHLVEFPSFNGSSPTNSSNDGALISYYSKVPWKYIKDLLVRYSLDIRLFGYGPYPQTKDSFLNWLKRTAEVHL